MICLAVNLRKLSAKAIWKAGALVLRVSDPQPAAAEGAMG